MPDQALQNIDNVALHTKYPFETAAAVEWSDEDSPSRGRSRGKCWQLDWLDE